MKLKGEMEQLVDQPGRFIHIKIGDGSFHMLRRPISIADVDKENHTITLVYKVTGKGTEWLSERVAGDKVDALGPGGQGFEITEVKNEKILVIGGGVGVPPLYHLTKELVENNDVTVILGFQSKEAVFYEKEFNQFGDRVQTLVVTDDGSYGEKGLVTDIASEFSQDSTRYFTCGPLPMLKAVKNQLVEIPGHISLEERMGCGIGACFACVCHSTNESGYVKVCKDGPVFSSNEVIL
ncbi:NAD-dependent dihydroorotate dehydrogenase B electron transfer subunit [Halalkalibacillus sediminis]|uniref:Dihydroorotate dehydrogenase B (NAD(+)), electron transfer subunit n=2 Tax=Halalkalibacillus sediminis TaxID=2018042 RepID=A0A2I0QYI0_9BACI|nr:NAD-dependent dihydroorotate dehydrogenase B electron transfer subunit [Halalkalibacillus sediminis]